MTVRGRTAILAAVVAVIPAASAVAAPARGLTGVPGPRDVVADNARYRPDAIVCTVGTAHFRVWWDDRPGSPDAPRGVDGRCETLPGAVRRTVAFAERIRSAEIALGFPAAPSDRATTRNGGDARHDVYFHRTTGRAETGAEWCIFLSRGASIVRSYSYTVVSNRLAGGETEQALEETFAHEYFHGIQCGIVPRIGTIPPWIAEGTANWMAASVTAGAFAASPYRLGNLLARLAESAAGDTALPRQGYDSWGLWYRLSAGGTDGAPIRRLLRRLRSDPRRAVAKLAAITPTLPALIRDYALDIRRGSSLAGTPLPDAYGQVLGLTHPVRGFDLAAAASIVGGDVRLSPLEYTYRRVTWPAGTVLVGVHVAGAAPLAGSVALAVDGGDVSTTPDVVGDDLEFRVPTQGVAGGALLVIASARSSAITVTPSARLIAPSAGIRTTPD